jgi:hypothetical protein
VDTAVVYDQIPGVNITGGPALTTYTVRSTATGTPPTISDPKYEAFFQVGDANDSLDQLLAPVTLTGNGSSSLTLDDEATTADRRESIDTAVLNRETPDGTQQFMLVNFQGMGPIVLDDAQSVDGNQTSISGVAAGSTLDVFGHAAEGMRSSARLRCMRRVVAHTFPELRAEMPRCRRQPAGDEFRTTSECRPLLR